MGASSGWPPPGSRAPSPRRAGVSSWHRRDLYAFGLERGGICERWLASTTKADNGPGTTPDEGLSYIIDFESGERCLLRDAIAEAGDQLLGADVMSTNGGWQVLCKFYDNEGPLPHHLHPSDEQMAPLGKQGKPRPTTSHPS